MKRYSHSVDVIVHLHRQGFTSDFQLFGNELCWIDGESVIRIGEFVIVEYHQMDDFVVFGIIALHYNIKGILLCRLSNYVNVIPPVLIKKVKELNMSETSIVS